MKNYASHHRLCVSFYADMEIVASCFSVHIFPTLSPLLQCVKDCYPALEGQLIDHMEFEQQDQGQKKQQNLEG